VNRRRQRGRGQRRSNRAPADLVLAVIVGVMLAGFFGVMLGVNMMALRDVRVVPGGFMIAALVMIGRRLMVLGGMFVMLSGFAMMLDSFL
jgi:hypothetical protein